MSQYIDFLSHSSIDSLPYHQINHLAWSAGHSMDWHQHPYLQSIHVLSGCLEVDWGHGWHSLEAHHCHILAPGIKHRLRSSSGQQQFGINFSIQHDERGLLSALHDQFSDACIVQMPNPPLDDLFSPHKWLQLSAVDKYCSQLLQVRQNHNSYNSEQDAMLRIIDQHLHHSSDVTAWAAQMGFSRATAQRRAQRYFNCGLAQIHEKRRMHQCAQTLVTSTASIEQIAHDWGFADATTFGRAFRRYYKKSPQQWRKQMRLQGA